MLFKDRVSCDLFVRQPDKTCFSPGDRGPHRAVAPLGMVPGGPASWAAQQGSGLIINDPQPYLTAKAPQGERGSILSSNCRSVPPSTLP